MKLFKSFALLFTLQITATVLAQGTYKLDTGASTLIWTGKKLVGQHHGSVDASSGKITWGRDGLAEAQVTMDMTSISNTDLDPEYGKRLVRHLKSDDFFDVNRYKTASFKSTSVEKIPGAEAGKPNYAITGDLTIKGITAPVTFNVLAWKDEKTVRAAGTMRFDRTLYDVRYRSGKFFESLGDNMIEDMVELTFDLYCK